MTMWERGFELFMTCCCMTQQATKDILEDDVERGLCLRVGSPQGVREDLESDSNPVGIANIPKGIANRSRLITDLEGNETNPTVSLTERLVPLAMWTWGMIL